MEFNLLLLIILLALIFDYINGFHDAANSIATIVATKVLTPFQAVVWAAFFNFLAYWVFGFGVADTVAKTAHTSSINLTVILSGLIAAIIWNLITWWKGIPSSSSHTLIGGFAGAAIAHGFRDVTDSEHAGFKIVNWLKAAKEGELLPSGVMIVIIFIIFAPLIGMIISYFISLWMIYSSKKKILPKVVTVFLMILVVYFLNSVLKFEIDAKDARFVNSKFLSIITYPTNIKWLLVGLVFFSLAIFNLLFSSFSSAKGEAILKKMQLISSAAFSLGHGGNDSQKVMGIIAAAVAVYIKTNPNVNMSMGWLDLNVILPSEKDGIKIDGSIPGWIPLTCYSVIALGTLSGGWKIVKTMGSKITKVTAFEGVVAESAGALTLFMTEHFKIPVSTTHTITGSIIGVGITKRISAVRWGVTINLIWAWALTIPISGILAALIYYLLSLFLN
ncbi:MAG: inorganic phosphate transporter [Flavobacteriaceae bacterium]|nr:inorganic phosphate transporter [Flavobacteriaceae bacterium]